MLEEKYKEIARKLSTLELTEAQLKDYIDSLTVEEMRSFLNRLGNTWGGRSS